MQTPAQLRQEIRRVKAEIEATVQSAQPRGMWESFMGADAQRVEDAEAKVLQLKAELSIYVETLKSLAASAPSTEPAAAPPVSSARAPAPSSKAPVSSVDQLSPESLAAACKLRDARELAQLLRSLKRDMEGIENVGRHVQRMPGSHGHGVGAQARRAAAVEASFRQQEDFRQARTGGWDREAAEANLLAHALGIPLALPRRRITDRELAVGATGCFLVSADKLASYIMESDEVLIGASDKVRILMNDILRAHPEVAEVPVRLLPPREVVEATESVGGMSDEDFIASWRELFDVLDQLDELRRRSKKRSELLMPLQRWQRTAKELQVRGAGRSPLPLVNEEQEMGAFIGAILAQRASWEGEVDALERTVQAAIAAKRRSPEFLQQQREAFDAAWQELLIVAKDLLVAAGSTDRLAMGKPLRRWEQLASRAEALADDHGFTPRPLRFDNQTMDGRAFAKRVAQGLPAWKKVLNG